ncbi:hypothetical protein JQ636_28985 [Bradyrhizobium japonicum]|uniref:hypothetical protein n=1 Tax=Bradyrhizobium japonicum TaxID=375 RepID=UPI0012FE5EC2|nr:hypothetical protein [Bradyrhizobium japonicum]MBR0732303.1 hypothetical protein [Bradyrhizobium japonicum]MBR0807597.1 hypothetical protein [Bradyrhizobium japonicum]
MAKLVTGRAPFARPVGSPFQWFEHDLRANAFRVCREGKPLHTLRWRGASGPDHALAEASRHNSATIDHHVLSGPNGAWSSPKAAL